MTDGLATPSTGPVTGQPGIAEFDDAVPHLAELLAQIGQGRSLPADGSVTLLPAPAGKAVAAVLGFTAHHLIAADVDHAWLEKWLVPASDSRPAEIGLPLQPRLVARSSKQCTRRCSNIHVRSAPCVIGTTS